MPLLAPRPAPRRCRPRRVARSRAARLALLAAVFAATPACFSRANLRPCLDDVDCSAGEYCLFVSPVRGVCQPGTPRDAGVTPDAGATSSASAYVELEQTALRSNDTGPEAEVLFERGAYTIVGTLGAFDGLRPDVDHYALPLREGTQLEITGEPTGNPNLQLKLTLLAPGSGGARFRARSVIAAEPGRRLRREVYVPFASTYVLRVEDARNALSSGAYVGGVDFTYRIEVKPPPSSRPPIGYGRTRIPLQLGTNGILPIFRIDVAEPASLTAETFAREALGASDPALWLVRRSPTGLVASSEDSEPASHRDARLGAFLTPGTYELAVDVQLVDARQPPAFDVAIGLFGSSQEQEPNDDPIHPFPIASPPASIAGAIGPPTEGRADSDYYQVSLTAGQLLTLRVSARSELRPQLTVLDPSGIEIEWQRNPGGQSSAPLELLVPRDGNYLLRVEDARNVSDAAPLGGLGYEYDLTLRATDRTATVIGTLDSTATVRVGEGFPGPGSKRWYRFVVPAPGHIVALEARPAGAWPVGLRVYGRNGASPVGEATGGRFASFLEGGEYWMSVFDRSGRGDSEFVLSARRLPTTLEDDVPASPSTDDAKPPLAIRGVIKHSETDAYAVDLEVGFAIAIATLPGSSVGASAQTDCELVAPDGRVIARCGAAEPGISRALDVPIPMTGRYAIRINGRDGANGAYSFYAEQKTCAAVEGAVSPGAREGALVFNEVLVRATDDQNNDGSQSPSADAFVEIGNVLESETLDIGGLTLRDSDSDCDASGLHRVATFACGTVLPPRGLAVVFGGGTLADNGKLYGSFGGALVQRSNAPNRCRLHLDPSGDVLRLVDRDGVDVASFSYPDASLCGGLPCDCQGTSCARDPDFVGPFVESLGASATPGRLFDGASSAALAPNDLCEGAREVAFGEIVAESPQRATDNYRGSCGLDGRELVYSFTLDRIQDIEIEARGADAIYIRESCSPGPVSDLACAAGDTLRLPELAGGPTPKRYFVFVESSAPFTFRVTATPPRASVPGDRCGLAIPIGVGDALYEQTTIGAADDYRPSLTCGLPNELRGRDVAFVVSLRAAQSIDILVEPMWPFDPAVFVTSACGGLPTPCIAASDNGVSGEPETLRFTPSVDGDYFIVVDSYRLEEQGYFDLSVKEVSPP